MIILRSVMETTWLNFIIVFLFLVKKIDRLSVLFRLQLLGFRLERTFFIELCSLHLVESILFTVLAESKAKV